LAGQPLIAYSIQQAKKSGLFRYVAVSSDSQVILDTAKQYGADLSILRPEEMATDTAAKLPAIRHCVTEAERQTGAAFDAVVDLDATSPLRFPEDIVGAFELLQTRQASNVITGAPARRSPYFNLVEVDVNGVVHLSKRLEKPVVRRQDAPKCYDMNASVYVWRRQSLMENEAIFQPGTVLYEMPEERSIDIDSVLDFDIVEYLMKRRAES